MERLEDGGILSRKKVIGRPDVRPPAEEGCQKPRKKKKKEEKKPAPIWLSAPPPLLPSLLKRNTCSVGASKYEIQFSSPKQCFY